MAGPLKGIRVLDLTRILAGPYATMILRDLGAEVIKIEQPGVGDEARDFGPFKNDFSLYFMSVNRGKKSITLNLKSPRGKELFLELVKGSDLLVENFRPGTMEKLGLDYESLKTHHPSLLYAACSGFGQTGPVCNAGRIRYDYSGNGRNYQYNRRARPSARACGDFDWRYNVSVVHRYRNPLRTSASRSNWRGTTH